MLHAASVRYRSVIALLAIPGVLACAHRGPTPAPLPTNARSAEPIPPHLQSGRWLRIIATNDFHGALEPRRDASGVLRGGAATLAGEIARARAECRSPTCSSILLDGGDEFQGTPASNFSYGRPVVELFNHLGYAGSALGNHEFDWTIDTLRARMREAHYPILGANVRDAAGNDVPWIPDDTIVRAGGVRVGVIGLATIFTPTTTRPTNVATLRFADPAPVVDAHARTLRARGAQVVIVIAHEGAFCDRGAECRGEIIDLAQHVTERIDAIVSGHTHTPVTTQVRGIPIVQARSSGSALGVIDLPLDAKVEAPVQLRDILPATGPSDVAVASMVKTWTEGVRARVERPVAHIAERLEAGEGGSLGYVIADAQRYAGKGDLAIMNPGGVRTSIDTGMATYGSLFEVQPFGNGLVRVSVRGRDLRPYLERVVALRRIPYVSGVTITVDSTRPAGTRIHEVRFSDGALLDDNRVYALVMSDFLSIGGDGLGLTPEQGAIKTETLGIVDLDALIAYLQWLPSPVRAPATSRVVFRSGMP